MLFEFYSVLSVDITLFFCLFNRAKHVTAFLFQARERTVPPSSGHLIKIHPVNELNL